MLSVFFGSVVDSAANTTVPVRVGLYENRPKIYMDEADVAAGFFPALIDGIARREGWDVKYVPGSWPECMERLERGEIDLMPDVAMTPERRDVYTFSDETALISWAVVYARSGLNVSSFFDLEDKRIALLRGSVYHTGPHSLCSIMEQFNIPATFVEYDSYLEVFQGIESGAADAGVVNNIFGSYAEEKFQVERTPIVFSPSRLHFAFPKDSGRTRALKEGVDRQLREMKADATSEYHEAIDTHLYGAPQREMDAEVDFTAEEKAWLRAHPDIRLGFDPEFFPFEFLDDRGRFSGIASDYVDILEDQFGVKMRALTGLDWSEVMNKVARREVDVLACVGQSAERSGYLLFSKPYCEFHRVILTRTDMPFITGVSDLAGMRVGVQKSSSHDAYLRENTGLSFTTYPTVKEAVLALSGGKIDALIGNLSSCTFWIRRLNLTNLKIAAPASSEVYTLHFAVRRDWPELVGIINKCLDHISEIEQNKIQQRWVGLEYEPEATRRVAWRVAIRTTLIAAVVLGAAMLWLGRLKQEISRRKKVEAELLYFADELTEANVKLEEMDRLKNMFIASVSHELRTPLNSIIGFSGVLLKGMTGELTEKQKDQLSRIHSSARHLLELITDIIDISKIEAGAVDVHPASFLLQEVITECEDSIQPQLAAKPLSLSTDIPENVELHTDRKRLRQCLLNYLSNAVKYSEQGDIRVTVRRLSDDRIRISVSDTGIGIAEDDIPRLFQPFERMDSHLRVKAGGTGLGLYLTRKIVTDILQGEIHVESVKGQGSVFSLTIPRNVRTPPASGSAGATEEEGAG